MDEADRALRNLTYRMFVEVGRAPRVSEVADGGQLSVEEVGQGWRRLSQEHALVLQDGADAIRMANPFSAVPTSFRVEAAGRWWFANCAWDAFGVCASLHVDGRVETTCADCGQPIGVEVRNQRPDDATLIFHCLVPAAHWWDDIVFS